MHCIARYVGDKQTAVVKDKIYRVGVFQSIKSYTVRCKGTEFVYFTLGTMLKDWIFYKEADEPTECP